MQSNLLKSMMQRIQFLNAATPKAGPWGNSTTTYGSQHWSKFHSLSSPLYTHATGTSRVRTIAVFHVVLAVQCLLSKAGRRLARLESGT